jgi:hypothetical protein
MRVQYSQRQHAPLNHVGHCGEITWRTEGAMIMRVQSAAICTTWSCRSLCTANRTPGSPDLQQKVFLSLNHLSPYANALQNKRYMLTKDTYCSFQWI